MRIDEFVPLLHISEFAHVPPFRRFILSFGKFEKETLLRELTEWYQTKELKSFFQHSILEKEHIVRSWERAIETFLSMSSSDQKSSVIAIYEELIQEMSHDRFMLLSEAARLWGKDPSTIRHALHTGSFAITEVRRKGKNWFVTERGMNQAFQSE